MKVDYIGLTQTVPIEAAAGVQLVRLAPFAQHIDGCHLSLAALHNGATGPIYEARLHVVTCAGERIHMGASKKRRIDHCIIVLKGLPSKQKARWYL
jgi:hypothetical protein